jgi:hypothetical protein
MVFFTQQRLKRETPSREAAHCSGYVLMRSAIPVSNLSIGSTPESQREFISSLETDTTFQGHRGQPSQKPPIANDFALGYTYQDVLDTDQNGK